MQISVYRCFYDVYFPKLSAGQGVFPHSGLMKLYVFLQKLDPLLQVYDRANPLSTNLTKWSNTLKQRDLIVLDPDECLALILSY